MTVVGLGSKPKNTHRTSGAARQAREQMNHQRATGLENIDLVMAGRDPPARRNRWDRENGEE
jgi:hypothetical protein